MVVMVLKLVVLLVAIVVADSIVVKIGVFGFAVPAIVLAGVFVPAMSSVGLGRCGRTAKIEHAQNILSGGFTWQNT